MLKKLLSHVKEYKTAAILTPTFMLLEVIMEMVIPLLMASIIDDGVNAGNMTHIFKVGGLMVVAAGLGLFGGIMGGKYGAISSAGFAKNLREAMFGRIQTYSFANIDKFSSSSLITRLTTDVTNVQNAFQMILRMGMRAPASLIVALTMSIIISPRLSLVYVGAVVFLVIVIAILLPKTHKIFTEVFEKYDAMNQSVQENISAIRVVKAYVREEHEIKKFHKASENIYRMFIRAEKVMVTAMPLMTVTVYACILLISWFGAHMIVDSSLTTGQLMSLLTYCMNILMSLMMLAMMMIMITMSTASATRIVEVIDEESTIVQPENPVMEVPNGSISFEHVNFTYNQGSSDYVLSDINLDIAAGETIGIIGGTGSSKTSLVNLISRLYDVTEGSVSVGGTDVRKYDIKTLRDAVSVVLQKNVLFSGSIYENLRWGDANATDEECRHAAKLACADEFIEKFPDGYNTHIEQGGTNVSGGQRQRLCIARALLKKPKVLILDDSTSAVDTATDAKIRRAFREEIPGTTKLIIAQRISSVMDADRIIVLDDGRIVDCDTHERLLEKSEIYREVYESQTGGGTGDFD
ncbi:MAG: ABC transporter ATP-binding protein, partial [Lachnospiraceae bacterium]|nr:ABC transporter ATP-binding protein [Lachnospiraceae bacterium]